MFYKCIPLSKNLSDNCEDEMNFADDHPNRNTSITMINIFSKLFFISTMSLKWLLAIFLKLDKKNITPVHVFFCLVDHYEPGTGAVGRKTEIQRVDTLLKEYPLIADRHKDFYGNIPRRTWFFPPHYHRNYNLKKLVSLCQQGYGEIELHLHHGKDRPDTDENLRNTILQCIKEYSQFGIFGELDGEKRYGFIHGDWALDNSRNGKYCGVNNELVILKETGCFADFTHPSLMKTTPSKINAIYYATDNPEKEKSYNKGIQVTMNGAESGDLMIIQGPLHPFFKSNKPWSLRILGDSIDGNPPVTKKRIDTWIKTNICVKGKRDFVFIKTHTHGATDSKAVLGKEIDQIFSYLETKYNDGKNFILHYVTARELYNIIKAVESGEDLSNPEIYRDYLISKPLYDSSKDIAEASLILKGFIQKTYSG